MFRKIKRAWMVMDVNGVSQLTVDFAEPYEGRVDALEDVGAGRSYCSVYPDGTVCYGHYDSTGKWWSSNPQDIYARLGVEVMDICYIKEIPGMGPARSIAHITRGFAEHILKEFNIPFHITKRWDASNRGGLMFVQSESIIGKTATYNSGTGNDTVTVIRKFDQYGAEWFVVEDSSGRYLYLTWNSLLPLYDGISQRDFLMNICKK